MVLNAIHREAENSFDHNEIVIHIFACHIFIFRFVNSICNLCVSLYYYGRRISFSAHFSLCSFPVMAVNSFWSFIGCAINFMVDLLIFRNNSNLLHGYHYYSQKRTYIIETEMEMAVATATIAERSAEPI